LLTFHDGVATTDAADAQNCEFFAKSRICWASPPAVIAWIEPRFILYAPVCVSRAGIQAAVAPVVSLAFEDGHAMTTANCRTIGQAWGEIATLVGAISLFLIAMLAPTFAASTIIDTDGFESPSYSLGALQGQHSWVTGGMHSSTATVESTVAAPSSSQAVQVDRGANSDDYWYIHELGFPTQRFVTVDWDMRVSPANTGAFGPFFGIRSFDDHGLASPGVLGSLGVDATTGDILFETATQFAETGTLATFNEWHHFRLVLDFTLLNYQAFFDDTPLITTPFAGLARGVNDFTDADISAVAAGGDVVSQAATGTAYFDNFLVRDGLVGDYDQNGVVEPADYSVWTLLFGSGVNVAGNGADGNANGNIDAADYTVWRDHLGASLFSGTGSSSFSSTAVPEPSALVMAICGLVAVGLSWRRC
jgi:hypothetical protein